MRLEKDDYLKKDYEFWKSFRKELTKDIQNDTKVDKTKENIVKMAKEIGIKPTARYFNMSPSTVRSYMKDYEL